MTADERAAAYAEEWMLCPDAEAKLAELLDQHADERLELVEQRLRAVAQTYDRKTERWIIGAACRALGEVWTRS